VYGYHLQYETFIAFFARPAFSAELVVRLSLFYPSVICLLPSFTLNCFKTDPLSLFKRSVGAVYGYYLEGWWCFFFYRCLSRGEADLGTTVCWMFTGYIYSTKQDVAASHFIGSSTHTLTWQPLIMLPMSSWVHVQACMRTDVEAISSVVHILLVTLIVRQ
jgi:hypothetical protein